MMNINIPREVVNALSSNILAFQVGYLIPILLPFILTIGWKFGPRIYKALSPWLSLGRAILKRSFVNMKTRKKMRSFTIEEVLETAGYSYDPKQDIFYSNLDAWQRDMGYCRLYDEAAAPLSMIIDCEPIYFEYEGQKWLIEFWKGQYGMTTGCEIGIYSTKAPDINITGTFNGTFYNAVGNDDLLDMALSLKKHGKTVFERIDRHWWLTGFKLGEFSNPWELTMILYIFFKDIKMRDAFIEGLKRAGYSEKEFYVIRKTIGIKFDKPKTEQPYTRTEVTDEITQRKNKLLCDKFQEITKDYDNSLDKIKAIQENAPSLLGRVINIGKPEGVFRKHKKIEKHLK